MNLRKDHYRSVPGCGGLPAEDSLTAAAGGAQAPPAQRPLNSGTWGENAGKGDEARAALSVVLTAALRRVGLPCASALPGTAVDSGGRSDGPRRRCAASLSSLFFSPRFQLSSAPATPPRALAPAGGRLRSEPLAGPPRRRGRAASRVSQNSPRSPGALGRGVQSPRRRQRRPRGARRSRLDKPNSNLVPERCLSKN